MKLGKNMRVLWFLLVSLFLAATLESGVREKPGGAVAKSEGELKTVLIDGFASAKASEINRAKWTFVSDRATGGRSVGKIEFTKHDDRPCLHLTGSVLPGRGGGFIEARLSLLSRRRSFDAGMFKGIRLRVKAGGGAYAVHLRTADTKLRWQFYQAAFATKGEWREITIPFERFRPKSMRVPLNVTAIRSIAVAATAAAAGQATADIFVDEIAFYGDDIMFKKLTPAEERVIIGKGTERPFSGKYDKHFEEGVYTCKRCGSKLYESSSKFNSGCGWPAFDDELPGAVKRTLDRDGIRTEITCAKCGGHLGHVFTGERLTAKNTRHCVNSISMDFIPSDEVKTQRAIFASGCFWGTEYHLQKAPGVISTAVGYTGGRTANPTYKQVCTDRTGHAEAVEVVYDPEKTSYEKLARLFFETHDFTQLNRQGPDIGKQYRSAVFYLDDEQKETTEKLIQTLKEKGFAVKTEVTKASKFWPAELYHQDYYKKNGKLPYCHIYRRIF